MKWWGFTFLLVSLLSSVYCYESENYIITLSYLIRSYEKTLFIEIPTFNDTLILNLRTSAWIKWSPTGNYITYWDDDSSKVIIRKMPNFRYVNSMRNSAYFAYIFFGGDTFVDCTNESFGCVCRLYSPPFFTFYSDSFVLPRNSVYNILGCTNDGRFFLIDNILDSTITHNYLYDRLRDTILLLDNYCALTRSGLLICPRISRFYSAPVIWISYVYCLDIINLYDLRDTVRIENLYLHQHLYWPLCAQTYDIANNENKLFIPILIDSFRFRPGIISVDLTRGEIDDTIYPEQIYPDSFVDIVNLTVSPDGRYSILEVGFPYFYPYPPPNRTVSAKLFYDLHDKRILRLIDSTSNLYVCATFSPVPMRLVSKVSELRESKSINTTISLTSSSIIILLNSCEKSNNFSLLDLTGRTVHRWQVEPKDGDKVILPLPEGLPNGVYLLRAGSGKIVGKVVLMR